MFQSPSKKCCLLRQDCTLVFREDLLWETTHYRMTCFRPGAFETHLWNSPWLGNPLIRSEGRFRVSVKCKIVIPIAPLSDKREFDLLMIRALSLYNRNLRLTTPGWYLSRILCMVQSQTYSSSCWADLSISTLWLSSPCILEPFKQP